MSLSVLRKSAPLLALGFVLAATNAASGKEASSLERGPNGVSIRYPSGVVRIELCSDHVIHVIASSSPLPPEPLVPVVVRPCTGTSFTTASDQSGFRVLTKDLRIEIHRDTGAVRFFTRDGKDLLDETQTNGRLLPSPASTSSEAETGQTFQLSDGESVYGLGQHQEGFLDLRDIPVRLLQANTNIAIPFLVSSKGYGLLWNNPALTDFNPATEPINLNENGEGIFQTGAEGDYGFLLSGNYRDKLRLAVDGRQIIDLNNMWLPLTAGAKIHLAANTSYKVKAETGGDTELAARAPSDTMAFRSHAGDAIDYYFLYGPEPSQVVAQYRELTGAAPLLPKWAYGFWQCRERYSSEQQILDTAAEFRNRKIPVDVLVQDWQYWGKYGWNAMRFDETAYPHPAEMLSALHHQDLHMVISVWAKFGAETAVNHEMEAAHLVLTSAASTGEPGESKERENWADLFNPKAQKMFWSDLDRNLFSAGIDGWWLDASEPEGDPLKNDNTFLGPGKLVRNAYPLFETSAVYQGQRATTPDKRVVILTRSAYAGEQRNSTISWSGDISANWETLRRQIPAGLGFSMSGFPYWTTDIGGFFRPSDQYTSPEYRELLIRWFQFGAFCPIFRIHGFRSQTEMWHYGPEVEQILRKYDELRYRLLPYIYSSAWGVTSRGETVMKGLPFMYPRDPSLRQVSDQFFFGDSLLINPVTEPHATTRSIVLPGGEKWVDFWTGRSYQGGQTITADAPIDKLPIMVKEGSILPLGPVVQFASQQEDSMEIRVYGGKDATFEWYEDSGDGYDYEHGSRAIVHMRWNDKRHLLSLGERSGTFPGLLAKRTLKIVLVGPAHGVGDQTASEIDRSVIYDGHAMQVDLTTTK